ncbi:MarR family transcriptional regulator [Natranaeroarchaeum aerophilus]|uniref:TrmB family transcriptional regulator n=1 Tax=Natranaeroarchaeum aerophilus TaxID=2917711 RepID=A0AAE3FST6_9EURY|nr:helix-turn-helix domain-containing protein [Natranaeroarchaeum aerophilus]MCL9813934.1 TrmB family transcriptional regulator [Natranaeroarchaeum aerophilus]
MSQVGHHLPLPEEITSPRAKLVYLHIAISGDVSVRELEQTLRMSKLALFGVLDSLESGGFISQVDQRYTCKT